MDIVNTLKAYSLSEKQYFQINSILLLVLVIILGVLAKGSYNGVLTSLKVSLYIQCFICIMMQVVAVMANKTSHIKYLLLGSYFFLFCTTFYLDNFFYGSTAGFFGDSYVSTVFYKAVLLSGFMKKISEYIYTVLYYV
ncbi:hypothetical protein L2636_18800 [Acinetobacter baumannii]|uniref:hypothetical protein n=1 Tax=Acinetobacter baumannii TaxID=470 RepID=UPI0021494C0D|nr:hypothetical protein [Acinetobacter baumannii]MCR0099601.1 hypothetical protein [Acinetobacter baumannii]